MIPMLVGKLIRQASAVMWLQISPQDLRKLQLPWRIVPYFTTACALAVIVSALLR